MHDWEKFKETSLPGRKDFYSHLNMEDTPDADYTYQYAKANTKYVKDYHRNKESQYIQYWDVNNLYG